MRRPTSPHLLIYRWQIGNQPVYFASSDRYRAQLGGRCLCYWLVSLASGQDSYASATALLTESGRPVAAGRVDIRVFYHLLNGIRHLFWDLGRGFERTQRHASGWFVVIAAFGLTLGVWMCDPALRLVTLRSPLGRVLGLGSAKDGTGHWWAQRLSAIALVPLSLWFLGSLAFLPGLDYLTLRAWLSFPVSGLLTVLLVTVASYHSYLGTRVVVEDYVAYGRYETVMSGEPAIPVRARGRRRRFRGAARRLRTLTHERVPPDHSSAR